MENENLRITDLQIRIAANGYIVARPLGYADGPSRIPSVLDNVFVFEDIDSMFSWIRKNIQKAANS